MPYASGSRGERSRQGDLDFPQQLTTTVSASSQASPRTWSCAVGCLLPPSSGRRSPVHHDLDIRWDTASERNLRATNADAVATRRDPATGELVFAVADGIGDSPRS